MRVVSPTMAPAPVEQPNAPERSLPPRAVDAPSPAASRVAPARSSAPRAAPATRPAPAEPSQVAGPRSADPLDAALATVHRELQRRRFSGVVLVARGDEVLSARAYGQAVRGRAARPNRLDTVFDVGSIAKPFTAAAIMRLVDEGRLSLETPLRQFVDVPADLEGLTLRHLLTHTSGLGYPSDAQMAAMERAGSDPRRYFSRFLAAAEREAPRGTFLYNNLGYSLLAYIVERTSGMSYEAYVRQAILLPAGMRDTSFDGQADTDHARAARGYEGRDELGTAGYLFSGWGSRGATGIVTSAPDLLRFARALKDGRILSAESLRHMWTPATSAKGPDSYGLGWSVDVDERGVRSASHSGSTAGFASLLTVLPREGLTIVTLTNQSDQGELTMLPAERIARARR